MRQRVLMGVLVASLLPSAGACSGPCGEFKDKGGAPPSWGEHAELVPAGGVICRADPTSATVDFPDVEDPVLVVVDHLEARGWARRGAITRDRVLALDRGDEVLHLSPVVAKQRVVFAHSRR